MMQENLDSKVKILKKGGLDEFSFAQISKHINNFFDFYNRKFGYPSLKLLRFHIKQTRDEGNQSIFIIKTLLKTDFGRYHSKNVGFNEVVVVEDSIKSIKNQIKSIDTE